MVEVWRADLKRGKNLYCDSKRESIISQMKLMLNTFNNYSKLKLTLKGTMYLPFEEHKQDMRMSTNVLHSRTPSAYLSSQDVVKYLGHIFFSLLKKI